MAQTEMIASVVQTLLAFGALWILISCCWKLYRLDALRDKLFELRHELFVMAEGREIAFENPAYRLLRAQLNRMLARAHRITGLMLLIRAPEQIENPKLAWYESLATLPEETRKKLEDIELRMNLALVLHLLVSPITIVIIVSGIISTMIRKSAAPPQERHRRFFAEEMTRSIEVLDRIPTEDKDKDALLAVG